MRYLTRNINLCEKCAEDYIGRESYIGNIANIFEMFILPIGECDVCGKTQAIIRTKKGTYDSEREAALKYHDEAIDHHTQMYRVLKKKKRKQGV